MQQWEVCEAGDYISQNPAGKRHESDSLCVGRTLSLQRSHFLNGSESSEWRTLSLAARRRSLTDLQSVWGGGCLDPSPQTVSPGKRSPGNTAALSPLFRGSVLRAESPSGGPTHRVNISQDLRGTGVLPAASAEINSSEPEARSDNTQDNRQVPNHLFLHFPSARGPAVIKWSVSRLRSPAAWLELC
ncbi:unnamed protein product [Pleuronectes platessa]|uniref:Uncharacterized protein n=1 Tax=Pleuronectes platessa TaxID=8262 RepID=A0A9N7TT18_PLEPL|nr:unnamed protein product [Pleuronectes platessa]